MASEAVSIVQDFIGCSSLVWASDGRVLRGTLSCVDHLGNLLLEQAEELRPPAPQDARAEHNFHGRLERLQLFLPTARPLMVPQPRWITFVWEVCSCRCSICSDSR
jgi:small nuclear ribonucleoprotein (snRNP)-like protein